MNNISLYIKNESGEYSHVDLFDDENIVMNGSIQNVKDITKTYTDFTYTFRIPASPTNNKLFKHWYNRSITNGFDSRTRSDAFIEINYTPFKAGNIQLDGTDMKGDEPSAYRVTFFGLLVNLKDKFKDDYLNDLDFSDTPITFDATTVETGLTSQISGSIIFPLLSSEEQWYYDTSTTVESVAEGTKNIHYESGSDKGVFWNHLKPAVTVSSIVDKIEAKYGITFSSDFTSTTTLDDLYMWCSREKGPLRVEALGAGTLIDWTGFASVDGLIDLDTNLWDGAAFYTSVLGFDYEDYFVFNIRIIPETGFSGVQWNVEMRDLNAGGEVTWTSGPRFGNKVASGTIQVADGLYDFLNGFYVTADSSFEYKAEIQIFWVETRFGSSDVNAYNFDTDDEVQLIDGTFDVSKYLPKIKVSDFVNGLIKMYNLVVIPIDDTSIYLDTLDSWLASGSSQDLTGRIKNGNSTVDRVDVPSLIEFKFEPPQSILGEQFEEVNNKPYGDLEYEAFDSASQKVVYGSPLNVDVPFETVVYERIPDENLDLTNIQYGAIIDTDLKPVLLKPHLFYGLFTECTGSTFGLAQQGSISTEMSGAYMPFHGNSQTNPSDTTTFQAELNEWDYNSMNNNLYSNYWSDYISDLYDVSRRMYKTSANLSQGFMTNLADSQNYNKIIYNGERYIVNSYSMNLLTGKTEFVLLNDIYDNNIDVNPPTAPTNLVASNVTTESFDLGWDASTDNVGVLGYYINKDGQQFDDVGNFTTSFISGGLVESSSADWTLNAYDAAGNISATSSILTVEMVLQDETAPSAITGLTASLLTSTDITLEWSASEDEPGGSGLAGYRVYRNGVLQDDDTDLIYVSTTEVPGTTNFWSVTAYDNAGNENSGTNFSKTQEDVATTVWAIDLKDSSTSTSCVGSYTAPVEYFVDRNTSFPTVGDTIYFDAGGETPLNGFNRWWWYNAAYQIKFGSDGVVTEDNFCF